LTREQKDTLSIFLKYVPHSIGAAAEAVLAARGRTGRLMRVVDQSPVPMVIVDNQRRYLEVNRPARLFVRLSLAEMRRYTLDDLTQPDGKPVMEAAWARLQQTGWVAGGPYEVARPDRSRLEIVFWGLANALPGRHLFAFAPAGWAADESAALEDARPESPTPLTPRELELLQLAARGFNGPMIAEELVLSQWTVRTHFRNMYTKLGVRDRAAAVAKAMRLGLID
jgi:DNA-binding CsgD family transcriptional regulator